MSDRAQAERLADALAGGLSLRRVGADNGLTYERVRQIVAAHPDLLERVEQARAARQEEARAARHADGLGESERKRATPRRSNVLYPDDDLEAQFREFLSDHAGEPVSSRVFIEWLAARPPGPSAQTFLIRFGPAWADVCARFGATPVGGRGRTITREACEAAVRRVRKSVGRPPTAAEYERLKLPAEPSRPVVQARLGAGRWSGVTAHLLEGSA